MSNISTPELWIYFRFESFGKLKLRFRGILVRIENYEVSERLLQPEDQRVFIFPS